MRFTVLTPTYNNGACIRAAIASVQRQTLRDYEHFVVADGAPEATLAIVRECAAKDSRIRLFACPKGERNGEASRHMALQEATGEAVCYLSDDDFWLPDHLATMAELLQNADFAHTRHTHLTTYFHIFGNQGSLADPAIRQRMLAEKYNLFGLTCAGHRLDAYRRLPVGWSPAPQDVWSDFFMWRKWLAAPNVRFAGSSKTTSIHLGRELRQHADPALAPYESIFWYHFFSNPKATAVLRARLPADERWVSLTDILTATAAKRVVGRLVGRFQGLPRLTTVNKAYPARDRD